MLIRPDWDETAEQRSPSSICTCGAIVFMFRTGEGQSLRDHWQLGHFDTWEYKDPMIETQTLLSRLSAAERTIDALITTNDSLMAQIENLQQSVTQIERIHSDWLQVHNLIVDDGK